MQIEVNDKLLTVKEVSAILGYDSNNTVYELIRKGKLVAFRLGNHGRKDKYNRYPWRIKESELVEFIKSGKNKSSKDRE